MKPRLHLVPLLPALLLAAGCQHADVATPATAPASVASTAAPVPPADTPPVYVFGWDALPAEQARPRGGSSRGAPLTLAPAQALPLPGIARAANAFERDRAAILALAGDYKVSFHFMESVGLTPDHQPPRPYHSWATEHVRVIEDTGRFISLQHTLVMFFRQEDGSISEPMLTKHWRQDWTYEDTDLHLYRGDSLWARCTLSSEVAAGTWSQAVFQVDDSPRYAASGRWEHKGNASVWTGENAFRPLPRRESTSRKDYALMEGAHRIVITPTGWLHEQRNWKRVAAESAGEPRYVAQELGLDRYERISAPSLAAGDAYWKKTGAYWTAVRRAWDAACARHDRFTLRTEVDGQRLFERHFAYARTLEQGAAYDPADGQRHATEALAAFIVPLASP